MSLKDKLFKKRQSESSEELKVNLKTKRKLSENQKNTIIAIVRDGIASGEENSTIIINIMMDTGICGAVGLNRTKDGINVILWITEVAPSA